jgi:hypothetical protein
MLDSFLTEMIMRRTTAWYEQRHPLGPAVTGIYPVALLGGNWFVHVSLANGRPTTHALVRMHGMSIDGIDIVEADATICPTCRSGG